MGLLSKASSITNVNKLAFPNFIISHNISLFAVFDYDGSYYCISNSIGFDGTSLLSSQSTKDFWDGVCKHENEIYKFESDNKTLNPMLQFFSFELIDQIKKLSLYKSNNKIYMLCNKDFDNTIINDLDKIDYDSLKVDLDEINKTVTKDTKLMKYEINFEEAISNFISFKDKDVHDKDSLKLLLLKELINHFSCFMAPFSTISSKASSIKCLFSVDKSIESQHLICHIVYNLRKVIGKSAEIISFDYSGEANSLAEIKSFLQAE